MNQSRSCEADAQKTSCLQWIDILTAFTLQMFHLHTTSRSATYLGLMNGCKTSIGKKKLKYAPSFRVQLYLALLSVFVMLEYIIPMYDVL